MLDRRKTQDAPLKRQGSRNSTPSRPSSSRGESPQQRPNTPRKPGNLAANVTELLSLISTQDLQIAEQGTLIEDLQDRVKRLEKAVLTSSAKSWPAIVPVEPFTKANLPLVAVPPCACAGNIATPVTALVSAGVGAQTPPVSSIQTTQQPAIVSVDRHSASPSLSSLSTTATARSFAPGLLPAPTVVPHRGDRSVLPSRQVVARPSSAEPCVRPHAAAPRAPSTCVVRAQSTESTTRSSTTRVMTPPSVSALNLAPGAGYLDWLRRAHSPHFADDPPLRVDVATSPLNVGSDCRRHQASPSSCRRGLPSVTETPKSASPLQSGGSSSRAASPAKAFGPRERDREGLTPRRQQLDRHASAKRRPRGEPSQHDVDMAPHLVLKLDTAKEGFLKRGGGRQSASTRSAHKCAWHK
mmetsp:Transcript_51555/g.95383  ORF Transcript_51555/g.95383 Transcript_51555/m.95383 type:complete len:411 (-) Transcript_51555:96-1328(-)